MEQSDVEPTIVGYWKNSHDKGTFDFPTPVPQSEHWYGQHEFLTKLKAVEAVFDKQWREYVAAYNGQFDLPREERRAAPAPIRPATVQAYRGYSPCRICEISNGCREYTFGSFRWPQGYIHYLDKHNVQPDPLFRKFIMETPLPEEADRENAE